MKIDTLDAEVLSYSLWASKVHHFRNCWGDFEIQLSSGISNVSRKISHKQILLSQYSGAYLYSIIDELDEELFTQILLNAESGDLLG